jgi:DNA-nicking Smr family endonuclease
MGDFGRILDEWESVPRSGGGSGGAGGGGLPGPRDHKRRDESHREREWFEQQLDRYPVVDKDAGRDAPDDESLSGRLDLPVEARLDLHGMTVQEALLATERFISSAKARGMRKIMVIHGKGRNGEGVLRREIRVYLERHRDTGAMGYAKGHDGGRGALWVLIRRSERDRGRER